MTSRKAAEQQGPTSKDCHIIDRLTHESSLTDGSDIKFRKHMYSKQHRHL
jgi:hypothetical protein